VNSGIDATIDARSCLTTCVARPPHGDATRGPSGLRDGARIGRRGSLPMPARPVASPNSVTPLSTPIAALENGPSGMAPCAIRSSSTATEPPPSAAWQSARRRCGHDRRRARCVGDDCRRHRTSSDHRIVACSVICAASISSATGCRSWRRRSPPRRCSCSSRGRRQRVRSSTPAPQ
jgi:hypothetical protein